MHAEGMKLLRKQRGRWEVHLKPIGCEGVD
jgi:hypothetical protein